MKKPILEWDYPIIGFISDGQQSLRMAIKELAPHVPNIANFIILLSGMILAAKNLKSSATQELKNFIHKDIAKPLVEKDRKLKANMKRNCGGYEILNAKLRICQRNPRNGKWLPLTYQQYVRCKLSLYFGIKEAFFCTILQKALSPFLKECAKFFVNYFGRENPSVHRRGRRT